MGSGVGYGGPLLVVVVILYREGSGCSSFSNRLLLPSSSFETTGFRLDWIGFGVVGLHAYTCIVGGERIGNTHRALSKQRKHSRHRTNPGTEAEPQQIVAQGYSHAYSTTFHS